MSKFWAVTEREYMERVRTRWFIIATIFGPVLFGILMFLPAYMASRSKVSPDVARIRVLDATSSELGRRIAAEVAGGVTGDTNRAQVVALTPADLPGAERTARQDALAKRIKGYLVLEPAVLTGSPARYVGSNATTPPDISHLQSVVRREVLGQRIEQLGISPSEAAAVKRLRPELRTERLVASGRGGSARMNLFFAFGVSMLLYMTIFIYGQAVLRGVMEEKQTRVAEVVVSSVRPSTLLGGKVLGVGAVGLTQVVIWIAVGFLLVRLRAPLLARMGIEAAPMILPPIDALTILLLVACFALGYTFYSALFASVGATVNSEQEAQQAQMPVAMMLVLSIVFVQPVLASPDTSLATALTLIPFTAPIILPLRMSVTMVPTWEIVASLVGLVVGCVLAVGFAARIYRTGLLMYGKRPTLREMMRWAARA